jgi:SM-20-related protein
MPLKAHARIAEGLRKEDLICVREALSIELALPLLEHARALDCKGEFLPARVGRGDGQLHKPEIRGDRICWLPTGVSSDAERGWLEWLDGLRVALNQTLFLNLRSVETHFAIYPPGAGYARHLDRFRDDDARVVSIVAYLNPAWTANDGGRLLYTSPSVPDQECAIEPTLGTIAAFISDRVPHQVERSKATRYSLAAWLRTD